MSYRRCARCVLADQPRAADVRGSGHVVVSLDPTYAGSRLHSACRGLAAVASAPTGLLACRGALLMGTEQVIAASMACVAVMVAAAIRDPNHGDGPRSRIDAGRRAGGDDFVADGRWRVRGSRRDQCNFSTIPNNQYWYFGVRRTCSSRLGPNFSGTQLPYPSGSGLQRARFRDLVPARCVDWRG